MKKLRVGMIGGGGPASFFGAVHRRAIALDDTRTLVAGAVRSDPQASLESAKEMGIQGYPDHQAMLEAVTAGDLDLDYVTIVTPNHAHYGQAKAFLEQGIPVLCEKPMTMSVAEAEELARIVREKNVPFILAHTYTGHPMMMLAREWIQGGRIGTVRKIESWYNQGWLAQPLENEAVKQATWRVDPDRAGISCCGGDIGSHAFVAATWVSGCSVERVSARLNTFVKGRQLDDDFNVIAELDNGGTALITATQIAIGHRNDSGFRIYGSEGSIEWEQEHAEKLVLYRGEADETYWIGANFDYFTPAVASYLRVPAGHHEDFFEALANLHGSLERRIRLNAGEDGVPEPYAHPGVEAGLDTMRFLQAAVTSSRHNGEWTQL